MAKARYDDLKDLREKVDFIEDVIESRTSLLQDRSILLESKLAMIDEKMKMMNEMISLLRQNMDMMKETRRPTTYVKAEVPEEDIKEIPSPGGKCNQVKLDETFKTHESQKTTLPTNRTRSVI